MKLCASCQKRLPLNRFTKRRNGKPTSYCKRCQQAYSREHYLANKDVANQRRYLSQKAQRKTMRELTNSLKDCPCADCGETHPPWAMDFDHRDPSKKVFEISEAVSKSFSKQKILKEVEKCDVVCALCHRYRTHGQKRLDVAQIGRAPALGAGGRRFKSSHPDSETGA